MGWNWKKLNVAKKNLIRRGAMALVAYEAAFIGTFLWVNKGHLAGSTLLWVAVIPMVTVFAFIGALGRYLQEESDEFHRELVVRCLLWGLAAVMAMMCFHGFLQLFGWKGNWPVFADLGAFFAAMLGAKLTYKVAHRPPVEA